MSEIFKIQAPLGGSNRVMVQDEDCQLVALLLPSPALDAILDGRPKAYIEAVLSRTPDGLAFSEVEDLGDLEW